MPKSASSRTVRLPWRAIVRPRLTATLVFPTPPLPLATTIEVAISAEFLLPYGFNPAGITHLEFIVSNSVFLLCTDIVLRSVANRGIFLEILRQDRHGRNCNSSND